METTTEIKTTKFIVQCTNGYYGTEINEDNEEWDEIGSFETLKEAEMLYEEDDSSIQVNIIKECSKGHCVDFEIIKSKNNHTGKETIFTNNNHKNFKKS